MVEIAIQNRKTRRKQERASKKLRKRRHVAHPSDDHDGDDDESAPQMHAPPRPSQEKDSEPVRKKKKKSAAETKSMDAVPYAHCDTSTAEALRRDDEEIAALEAKLGLSGKKEKARLKKEYAKLEGYGDDFGDFLDGLDDVVARVTQGTSADTQEGEENSSDDDDDSTREESDKKKLEQQAKKAAAGAKTRKGPHACLDSNTAAALRLDDEEIKALAAKLGVADKKGKTRLYKEYSKLEGYGEDFGEFLEDLDGVVDRVVNGDDDDEDNAKTRKKFSSIESEEEGSDVEEDEEIVPMKEPAFDDLEEDDSVMAGLEEEEHLDTKHATPQAESESDSEFDEGSKEDDREEEPDHDAGLTYRPTIGEDIYGNTLTSTGNTAIPQKYVPPHLRKQQEANNDNIDEKEHQESLRLIQRSLNNALNRLSEDTLVSVAQGIAKLYPLHPTPVLNQCVWTNMKNACVARSHPMVGLIPVYTAALCGVHVIKGDSAQLGEYLMEKVVLDLWNEVQSARDIPSEERDLHSDEDLVSKEASNLMLCLCYLYNFGIVHCSLMYDVVRDFIKGFKAIDVELLLLILSHCGRALRSDDPSALKEIVLLVQKRALEVKDDSTNASHIDYMVSAIMDLKNNKRRNQNTAYIEKTSRLRKILGQIKSSVAANNGGFRCEASLRISLSDLLNAEVKGRFWKIGASWVGNQYRFQDDDKSGDKSARQGIGTRIGIDSEEDTKLLKLASKYRMNTDIRRSIFCIIMGSADCDDAFEKLVRAELLKNRTERETVRVLMECCGNEKSFNKYYSHLASRICEFQPQAKFSFQLAFWDVFKTFDDVKPRKAANLAKLLFRLVAVHFALRLSVLKAIDMSSPEELSETATIFVTIFLSNLLEHFDNPGDLVRLINTGISRKHQSSEAGGGEDDMGHMDDGDGLRANLTVFLVQVMKASPQYKKGSKFRTNLKTAVKACDTDKFF